MANAILIIAVIIFVSIMASIGMVKFIGIAVKCLKREHKNDNQISL